MAAGAASKKIGTTRMRKLTTFFKIAADKRSGAKSEQDSLKVIDEFIFEDLGSGEFKTVIGSRRVSHVGQPDPR